VLFEGRDPTERAEEYQLAVVYTVTAALKNHVILNRFAIQEINCEWRGDKIGSIAARNGDKLALDHRPHRMDEPIFPCPSARPRPPSTWPIGLAGSQLVGRTPSHHGRLLDMVTARQLGIPYFASH
jgi:hypothetical protein